MKRDDKSGQMKMSFGMIFSIILIVIFIAFAFYAISKFLDIQDSVKIGRFADSLQADVDKMWNGNQGSQEVEYSLPTKIKEVCFKNEDYNIAFESDEFIDDVNVNHLDLAGSIGNQDKLCFDVTDGKVGFTIKKDYGENLVKIEE